METGETTIYINGSGVIRLEDGRVAIVRLAVHPDGSVVAIRAITILESLDEGKRPDEIIVMTQVPDDFILPLDGLPREG